MLVALREGYVNRFIPCNSKGLLQPPPTLFKWCSVSDEVAEREKRFHAIAEELRAAVDAVNDKIAVCCRSGLDVNIVVMEASVHGDASDRPIVQAQILKIWKY